MSSQAPSSGEAASMEAPTSDLVYRDQFVAAIERGLADVAAGDVVDDDELGRELDDELGALV
jgi:predicted transcriptional regulator